METVYEEEKTPTITVENADNTAACDAEIERMLNGLTLVDSESEARSYNNQYNDNQR